MLAAAALRCWSSHAARALAVVVCSASLASATLTKRLPAMNFSVDEAEGEGPHKEEVRVSGDSLSAGDEDAFLRGVTGIGMVGTQSNNAAARRKSSNNMLLRARPLQTSVFLYIFRLLNTQHSWQH